MSITINYREIFNGVRNKAAGSVVEIDARLAELLAAGVPAEEIARIRSQLDVDFAVGKIANSHDWLNRFGKEVRGVFGKTRE